MIRLLLKKLFIPTIWLSGRLGFSLKFTLIGVVVLVAMALLSQPLLSNYRNAVRIAERERLGLKVLKNQIGVLKDAVSARGTTRQPDTGSAAQLSDLARRIEDQSNGARRAGMDAQAARLENSWRMAATLNDAGNIQQHFAAWTAVVNALLDNMRESARYHRLNVDPQLDAAFEMLAVRLPMVLETLAKQRDALELQNEEMATYALSTQVALSESLAGLKSGIAQLLATAPDEQPDNSLNPTLARLLYGIADQQDATDKVLADPASIEQLRILATRNLDLTAALLETGIANADAHLIGRIDRLGRDQLVVAVVLVGGLLAIGYLFAGIYFSTLRSLRSLAEGTKDFCAGNLETRIKIDTRDELVLVARNFNTVATEFSRLLDVIREQNESRQRELERLVQERTFELNRKNELLRRNSARVEEELSLARDMQLAILPQRFPDEPDWSVSASMFPAREMGGDFYDCMRLTDGRHVLLVADVSGKGIAAAFFMAVSRTVLLDLAQIEDSPASVMAKANDLLCERNPMELFVTVFYAIYDPRTGQLDYACAGHNHPLRRSTEGRISVVPCQMDTALGIMPGLEYNNEQLTLAPGEMLLMYTDGVTEAFAANGEAYGESRLRRWMAFTHPHKGSAAMVASLVENVAEFVAEAEASDDLTCLILYRKNEAALLEYRMPSRVAEIEALAAKVEAALADRPDLAFGVNLCLEELITNTILYGLQSAADHFIDIRLRRTNEWLEIELRDDAPPYDPFSAAPKPDLDATVEDRKIGGLGVELVRTMMDEAFALQEGEGNLLRLRKRI